MHYGWIVDLDRMFDLAADLKTREFYHCIEGPKKRDYWSTCSSVIRPLMENLGLPFDKRVVMCDLSNGDVDPEGKVFKGLGLSLGTNYAGHIPKKSVKKLQDVLAPGVEPKWFLSPERWQWTRNQHRQVLGVYTSEDHLVLLFCLLFDHHSSGG